MTLPDYFYPNQQDISAISQTNPAVITTYNAHNYKDGLVVRVYIPSTQEPAPYKSTFPSLGMPQINGAVGIISVINTNMFSMAIDSTNFDPYVPGLALPKDKAFIGQVIPVSEDALTLTSATINNRNITPEIFGTSPSPNYPLNPVIIPHITP
jgi:hypothetical protein